MKGLAFLVATAPADMIGQRSGGSRSASGVQLGSGRGTLRLRSKGPATVEQLVSASLPRERPLRAEAACRRLSPSSPPRSRKRPSRRLTICWRATWASETASWVRASPSRVSQAICVCVRVCSPGVLCTLPPSSAATMVELGKDKKNPDELAEALDETLGDFAFPDEFVFDVWGAIGDAKVGRV